MVPLRLSIAIYRPDISDQILTHWKVLHTASEKYFVFRLLTILEFILRFVEVILRFFFVYVYGGLAEALPRQPKSVAQISIADLNFFQ